MTQPVEWEYQEETRHDSNIPRLTVLMSVYNNEQYVRSAIESVVQQSYNDFEFIIFDDASTDASKDIICSYSDVRIQRFFSKHNVGQAMLLNYGISVARGDYIAIMDADDISLRERFLRQITYLDQNLDISICGTWAKTFGLLGEKIWTQPVDHCYIQCYLLFDSPLIHPTTMIRRADLVQYQLLYDEKKRYAKDYDFFARCSSTLKMSNIPEILLKYRQSSGQISIAHRTEQLQSADSTRERLITQYFKASKEGVDIHNMLSKPTDNLAVVEKVRDWLVFLLRCNNEQKLYDTELFQEVVFLHWKRFCNSFLKKS